MGLVFGLMINIKQQAKKMIQYKTPIELQHYLKTNNPVLLDVRTQWEFDICHLNNSILMPVEQVIDALDELDKTKEYVIICHHGIRSLRVAKYLNTQGFNQLINLSGGVDRWALEVDKQMTTY